MRTDTLIKKEGFRVLFDSLDLVEVERFIALVKRDNFDYTQWRKPLWEDMKVSDLSVKAMSHYNQKKKE